MLDSCNALLLAREDLGKQFIYVFVLFLPWVFLSDQTPVGKKMQHERGGRVSNR